VEVKDPEVEQAREQLSDKIYGQYRAQIAELVRQSAALEEVQKTELMETLLAEFGTELDEAEAKPVLPVDEKLLGKIVDELMKKEARRMILEDGIRPDGRAEDEIRQIWVELDLFPHTHGSAMFKRGATQAVTVTTLGTPA